MFELVSGLSRYSKSSAGDAVKTGKAEVSLLTLPTFSCSTSSRGVVLCNRLCLDARIRRSMCVPFQRSSHLCLLYRYCLSPSPSPPQQASNAVESK